MQIPQAQASVLHSMSHMEAAVGVKAATPKRGAEYCDVSDDTLIWICGVKGSKRKKSPLEVGI